MTHLGDLLSAHLDGELDATERDRVDAHLAACGLCAAEREAIAAVRDRVRALPVLEPGAAAPRHPHWMRAAAAIAAAVVAAGLVVGGGEPASAFDLGTLNDQHIARVVADPGIATLRGNAP